MRGDRRKLRRENRQGRTILWTLAALLCVPALSATSAPEEPAAPKQAAADAAAAQASRVTAIRAKLQTLITLAATNPTEAKRLFLLTLPPLSKANAIPEADGALVGLYNRALSTARRKGWHIRAAYRTETFRSLDGALQFDVPRHTGWVAATTTGRADFSKTTASGHRLSLFLIGAPRSVFVRTPSPPIFRLMNSAKAFDSITSSSKAVQPRLRKLPKMTGLDRRGTKAGMHVRLRHWRNKLSPARIKREARTGLLPIIDIRVHEVGATTGVHPGLESILVSLRLAPPK